MKNRYEALLVLNAQGKEDTIKDIVDRLEGLPLAVELAAARTKVLAVTAIRDLLVDQMRLLGGGRRDAPPPPADDPGTRSAQAVVTEGPRPNSPITYGC